jgi:hypothetical protein
MSDEGDLGLDPGRFYITNGLWFVTMKGPRKDLLSRCYNLGRSGGEDGEFAAAFTDEDLAGRFAATAPEGVVVEPFHATETELLAVLAVLMAVGHTHLSVDPSNNYDQRVVIRELVLSLAGQP